MKENYLKIENKYLPIIHLLGDESFLKDIETTYKGFITCLGNLIEKPKVLFLGINPGPGAYYEINYKRENVRYPKSLFSHNSTTQLDWLKDGNARRDKINSINHKWYKLNEQVNNSFVKRMIDFIFNYYDLENNKNINYQEIESKINSDFFYWNICPIATTNTTDLDIILEKISKKNIVINGNEIKSKKELQNFFRQRTIELIHLINPELIVCLGTQAYKDLTLNTYSKSNDVTKLNHIKLRIDDKVVYKTFVVSRNGNWERKIKNLGLHLNQHYR